MADDGGRRPTVLGRCLAVLDWITLFRPARAAVVGANDWFNNACEGCGHSLLLLTATLRTLRRAYRKIDAIVAQQYKAVFGSLAIVVLTSLFSGLILALQTGIALRQFNQESMIGLIVAAAMCREMGPVMTGIAMAGLIGSTYAAEIGTMKVSEEIDALEVMSIDPVYFLVMPRMIALALAEVALTCLADLVGTAGGAVVSMGILNVSPDVYFRNAQQALEIKDIYGGLLKALVFAVTITTIACSQGMRAEHGAEGVGLATMRSVVYSFVYILMFDYLITWALY